jgi:hypothetical protein
MSRSAGPPLASTRFKRNAGGRADVSRMVTRVVQKRCGMHADTGEGQAG